MPGKKLYTIPGSQHFPLAFAPSTETVNGRNRNFPEYFDGFTAYDPQLLSGSESWERNRRYEDAKLFNCRHGSKEDQMHATALTEVETGKRLAALRKRYTPEQIEVRVHDGIAYFVPDHEAVVDHDRHGKPVTKMDVYFARALKIGLENALLKMEDAFRARQAA